MVKVKKHDIKWVLKILLQTTEEKKFKRVAKAQLWFVTDIAAYKELCIR